MRLPLLVACSRGPDPLTRLCGGHDSGKDKDSIHSRAYIAFQSPDALVAFHRGYDGWSFRDKAGMSPLIPLGLLAALTRLTLPGNISQAVVEFAPYQRIPVAPPKVDSRQGTIDDGALAPARLSYMC